MIPSGAEASPCESVYTAKAFSKAQQAVFLVVVTVMQKLNPTSVKVQSEELLYASLPPHWQYLHAMFFVFLSVTLSATPTFSMVSPLAVLISYKRLSISKSTISVEQKIYFLDYSHAV